MLQFLLLPVACFLLTHLPIWKLPNLPSRDTPFPWLSNSGLFLLTLQFLHNQAVNLWKPLNFLDPPPLPGYSNSSPFLTHQWCVSSCIIPDSPLDQDCSQNEQTEARRGAVTWKPHSKQAGEPKCNLRSASKVCVFPSPPTSSSTSISVPRDEIQRWLLHRVCCVICFPLYLCLSPSKKAAYKSCCGWYLVTSLAVSNSLRPLGLQSARLL